MPIVDLLIVQARPSPGTAPAPSWNLHTLADRLGTLFGSAPGQTWVRLHRLPADDYAENAVAPADTPAPVFVQVLMAVPPQGLAAAAQAGSITALVAETLTCPPDLVHVVYAPAGAGRVAFGGQWIDGWPATPPG
jgi:phenylpyruvate tautomerase PptA (4-oxalocrotonate tautomerase family)